MLLFSLVSKLTLSSVISQLLMAAAFGCSVSCLARYTTYYQPRHIAFRQYYNVDHQFWVGRTSTRYYLVFERRLTYSTQPLLLLSWQNGATHSNEKIMLSPFALYIIKTTEVNLRFIFIYLCIYIYNIALLWG